MKIFTKLFSLVSTPPTPPPHHVTPPPLHHVHHRLDPPTTSHSTQRHHTSTTRIVHTTINHHAHHLIHQHLSLVDRRLPTISPLYSSPTHQSTTNITKSYESSSCRHSTPPSFTIPTLHHHKSNLSTQHLSFRSFTTNTRLMIPPTTSLHLIIDLTSRRSTSPRRHLVSRLVSKTSPPPLSLNFPPRRFFHHYSTTKTSPISPNYSTPNYSTATIFPQNFTSSTTIPVPQINSTTTYQIDLPKRPR